MSRSTDKLTLNDLQATDQELLRLLGEHRFATTKQLARLTSDRYRTPRSGLRQTSRHLDRLAAGQHLVQRLERRVGGWQAGSAPGIWTLTATGSRTGLLADLPRLLRHAVNAEARPVRRHRCGRLHGLLFHRGRPRHREPRPSHEQMPPVRRALPPGSDER